MGNLWRLKSEGSPPHTRGKEDDRESHHFPSGITPAYAGKSNRFHADMADSWDHPRIRGEKRPHIQPLNRPLGSPPHTRGKDFEVIEI